MSFYATLAADCLVAILLVATIVSSLRLSRRIAGLKADEAAMRQTVGDLVVATATAERAITGLRAALAECDRTLAERLDGAERSCAELAAHVEAGQGVIARIGAIVMQSQSARSPEPRRAEPRRDEPHLAEPHLAEPRHFEPSLGERRPTLAHLAAAPAVAAALRAAAPGPERAEAGAARAGAIVSNGDRIGATLAAAQAISERALERIRARAA